MPTSRLRATRWLNVEPVGAEGRRFVRFALTEAQNAKQWTKEYLQEKGAPEGGDTEWQAAQLRRKYLTGKVVLHAIPGGIFERAILDTLRRVKTEEGEESPEEWNTLHLPLREGWTGERSDTNGDGLQKFSFDGDRKTVLQGNKDGRSVTPEMAEYQLFQEGELVWKWGRLRVGSDVTQAVRSTLNHWHIPWRGPAGFFNLVKQIELRRVVHKDPKLPETWQLRFIFK